MNLNRNREREINKRIRSAVVRYSPRCPALAPASFWLVCMNTWIFASPPAAAPCVTSPPSPSGSVKTHCLKNDSMDSFHQHCWRTDPCLTTPPPLPRCDGGERDGALNAALISAFLSRSQGTAGSEKPDISQPIRFSKNCICLLLFVREETFCLHLQCSIHCLTKILFVAAR